MDVDDFECDFAITISLRVLHVNNDNHIPPSSSSDQQIE
jgi:hypothetical protein